MKKDIVTLSDISEEDFEKLFKRAFELKERHKKGIRENVLAGKTVGLLFDKPSTRTRISFEAATAQLGGTPVFISAKDTQLSRNEPVKDVARVLSRYLDALVIRTYSQSLIEEFAEYSDIPVINALSDLYHPCQVLSDIMTIIECKGTCKGLKIVWVGDGNNVANSWINAAAVMGLNLVLACPEGYFPDKKVMEKALEKKCGQITLTSDPAGAVKDADVIYTDTWVSMGQEQDKEAKQQAFGPFQVNAELVKKASKEVIVMHCLPVYRGCEMTEEVLEGPSSVVWDQSENKLHLHKAVLEVLING